MKKILVLVACMGCLPALATPMVAQTGAGATLVAPPAIYLPAGGKVVTEINLSDDDVLGIIKQAIPAVADVVKELAPSGMGGHEARVVMGIATVADVQGLSESIQGITNVRLVAARYPRAMSPEKFLQEFSAGVTKAGRFSKILSDFGMFPGAVAIYALPDNAGCMGFVYIPQQQTAYALRVVGGVDVPKLIKWAGSIAKLAVGSRKAVVNEPQVAQPKQEPSSEPAAVQSDAPGAAAQPD